MVFSSFFGNSKRNMVVNFGKSKIFSFIIRNSEGNIGVIGAGNWGNILRGIYFFVFSLKKSKCVAGVVWVVVKNSADND